MKHSDPHIEHAAYVSLNFANQKIEIKDYAGSHQGTWDTLFCHLRIFARIVKQIRNLKGDTDNTHISAIWRNKKINYITPKEMIIALCNTVENNG